MSKPLLNITVDDIYPLDSVIGYMLRTIVRVHDRQSCLDLMTEVEKLIGSGVIAKSLSNISNIIDTVDNHDIVLPRMVNDVNKCDLADDETVSSVLSIEKFNILQATIAYSILRVEIIRAMYSSVTKMEELGMLSEDVKIVGKDQFDKMYNTLIACVGTKVSYIPLLDFGKTVSDIFRTSVEILHGNSEINVLGHFLRVTHVNKIWEMNQLRLLIKDVPSLGELLDYSPEALDKQIVMKDGVEVLTDVNGNPVSIEMIKYIDMQYYMMKCKLIDKDMIDNKILYFYTTLNKLIDREPISHVYREQSDDMEIRYRRWAINRYWGEGWIDEDNIKSNPEDAKRILEQTLLNIKNSTLPSQIRTIDDIVTVCNQIASARKCANVIEHISNAEKDSRLEVKMLISNLTAIIVKAVIKCEIPKFVFSEMMFDLTYSLQRVDDTKDSLLAIIRKDGLTIALGDQIRLESDTNMNIPTLSQLLIAHLEPEVTPKTNTPELLHLMISMVLRHGPYARTVVDYDNRDMSYAEFTSILTESTRLILDNLDRNLFAEISRYLEGEDYSKSNIGFNKFAFLKTLIDIDRLIGENNGIISGAYEANNSTEHNSMLLIDVTQAVKLIKTLTRTGGSGNIQRS